MPQYFSDTGIQRIPGTSADDGSAYAGMQNIDMGLAPLFTGPVCPVTDGIEPKMRPGPGRRSPAGPHFRQNPVALLLWLLQFWNLA